jgi:hypothetical protein
MNNSRISPATGLAEGASIGAVRSVIRTEAAAVFFAAVLAYADTNSNWLNFTLWFFVPDVAMLGYVVGPRAGAAMYNALHSYVGPILLYLVGAPHSNAGWLCLIWIAHIAFDRSLGYGLKYALGFRYTHLGRIGRRAQVSAE